MSDPKLHFAGRSLAGQNLRHHDFTNHIFYETDFRGADLYNAAISIHCQTFHGAKLDARQVGMFLKLIALANIAPEWKTGIDALVSAVCTPTEARAIDRYLKIHI